MKLGSRYHKNVWSDRVHCRQNDEASRSALTQWQKRHIPPTVLAPSRQNRNKLEKKVDVPAARHYYYTTLRHCWLADSLARGDLAYLGQRLWGEASHPHSHALRPHAGPHQSSKRIKLKLGLCLNCFLRILLYAWSFHWIIHCIIISNFWKVTDQ
jgi:hypothetical protein